MSGDRQRKMTKEERRALNARRLFEAQQWLERVFAFGEDRSFTGHVSVEVSWQNGDTYLVRYHQDYVDSCNSGGPCPGSSDNPLA